jgi:ubiquinol-cytochrome c reductase cytochrome b subunit
MTNEIEQPKSLKVILSDLMLKDVPAYANKIYYSLGFLSMTSFLVLLISGVVLAFEGPNWWLTTASGLYFRSIHLWAAQAFIFFIFLHLLIVFLTSGYRPPRRLTWVIGALMFFLVLIEAEFGYGLRGDFSSQWRGLQASDLYNGSGLGHIINNLNYAQIYGIHIIVIPLIILGLLFLHYLLVKVRGIATPFKKVPYRIVKADHQVLFLRGTILVVVILLLAVVFKSPFIIRTSIQNVANDDPTLMAGTLITEIDHTSDTATYLDTIDPYTYDTKEIYVTKPFQQYAQISNSQDFLSFLESQNQATQQKEISDAKNYFNNNGNINTVADNPVIATVSALTKLAQNGTYESILQAESGNNDNQTYVTRFLSDTGILDTKAESLKMSTGQYGMLHEEEGILPPGAWWLAPLGFLDNTVLVNDPNQDRDGAEILSLLILLLIAFPYIPYFNKIPEKIGLDKFIWKDKKIPIENI